MSKHRHKTETPKRSEEAVEHEANQLPADALRLLRDVHEGKAVDEDAVVPAAMEVLDYIHKGQLAKVPASRAVACNSPEHVADCFNQVIPDEGQATRAATPGAFPWATLLPIILQILQQFLNK